MNSFKEWLSDYLRYFVLILALILALGAIFLGVKLYQSTQTVEGDPNSITIVEGTERETEKQSETERETVTEKITEKVTEEISETRTEKTTEKITEETTEIITEKVTEKIPEKKETEAKTVPEGNSVSAVNETSVPDTPQTDTPETRAPQKEPVIVINPRETQRQTEAVQIETIQTEPPQTEPPETDPPEPVYMTMTGTCYMRSYADYGDNIMGTYQAGTIVEFLEDVGGWYKVRVDGQVGYMGARFFY